MKSIAKYYSNFIIVLRRNRPFLMGSYLEYILILIFFVALAIVLTDFVAFDITSRIFASAGDSTAGFLWLNSVDHGISPFLTHTDFVNYPYGANAITPIYITSAAIWVPMRLLSFFFGPVAALNIVMLWGYIGAAMIGYWLVKRFTNNISVAIFSGFTTAFVPYSIYKSSNHIAYIFSIVFVLILASFIALWTKPTKVRAALFSLSIALAFYTDGYYILLASVMVLCLVISGFCQLIVSRYKKIEYWRRLKTLFLSLILLIILIIPIAYAQITYGAKIKNTLAAARLNIEFEMDYYNIHPLDFITPPVGSPVMSLMNSKFLMDQKNSHSNGLESMAYVGFVSISLMVAGFVIIIVWLINKKHSRIRFLSNKTQNLYILMGLITLISIPIILSFMFSPKIHVFGMLINLPGEFLIENNIALWRVMGRFFIVLHVLITIFASFTLWVIIDTNKLFVKSLRYKQILGTIIVILLTILTAVEYHTIININGYNFSAQPSAYIWLKKQEQIKVIAEFPMVDPLHPNASAYATSQVYHGKKIVNLKESVDRQLTNTLGSINNPEAIDFVYSRGAQAIVTHNSPCIDVTWGVILFDDSASGMCIYRLDRPISNDKVFVKFGTGLTHNPNENRPDSFATIITGNNLDLFFIDNSFSKSKSGEVHFTMDITPLARNDFTGEWVIKQNKKIVKSGQILNSKAKIDAILSAKYDVQIDLNIDGVNIVQGDIEASSTIANSVN